MTSDEIKLVSKQEISIAEIPTPVEEVIAAQVMHGGEVAVASGEIVVVSIFNETLLQVLIEVDQEVVKNHRKLASVDGLDQMQKELNLPKNQAPSVAKKISVPQFTFRDQMQLCTDLVLQRIPDFVQVPQGGFMDIPIITESVLEQLDPKISENVKYLVFDSIQDVLFDLFKPHKNYLTQIEKGTEGSVLMPTSVSIGHLTNFLQTKLKKLLTYETTVSNLVKETGASFQQDFLKLDLYKEEVKVESARPRHSRQRHR